MTIDEIGRASEDIEKGPDLAGDLCLQRRRLEAAHDGTAEHRVERQKRAPAGRREALGERPVRRREREVEPDRDARAAALSMRSAAASERPKLGAATMTEVALRRPRTMRSRMAVLTEGEMP